MPDSPLTATPLSDPVCVCGHVEDEHSQSGECQVEIDGEPCFCGAWEELDTYDDREAL